MSNYSDSSFATDPNSSWYKIFSYIKDGSKILDIGCSSGNFGKVLIDQKNCVVDGIELDEEDFKAAQKVLRRVYNLNVETDDLSAIKDTYDYIYFGDVIEHLVTPIPSLQRIHKFFKPDGQLLFSLPNMAHASVRLMLLQGDFQYGETGLLDKTHLHYYTTAELQRVLTEAGYNLKYFDPVLKDFPEELVAQELKKVGLPVTPEFMQFLRTTEASIYQMVGAADLLPSTAKPVKATLPSSSPVDIFQKYLQNVERTYKRQLAEQKRHNKKLEAYAKDTVAKLEEAQAVANHRGQQLDKLKQNPVYRAARRIRHMRDK